MIQTKTPPPKNKRKQMVEEFEERMFQHDLRYRCSRNKAEPVCYVTLHTEAGRARAQQVKLESIRLTE